MRFDQVVTASAQARPWLPGVALLVALLAAVVSFWPLHRGAFVTDDDVFRLTSALVTHPWSAFYSSHFFEPFYFRPVGLVLWWYVYAFVGDSFASHAAVNVALHLGNAGLLYCLLRQWRVAAGVAAVAAFAFAFLPYSAAVAFWPSARFDLLCLFFSQLTVIAALKALDARAYRVGGWLFAAACFCLLGCWSKEQGYAIAAGLVACCVAAAVVQWRRGERALIGRLLWVAGVLSVVSTAAFVVRAAVLASPFVLVADAPHRVLFEGVLAYVVVFGRSTAALFLHAPAVAALTGSTLVISALMLLFRQRLWRSHVVAATLPLVVALAVVVAQAPITRVWTVLVDNDAFATATYARFHYVLFACVLVCLARLAFRGVPTLIATVLLAGILLVGVSSTRGLARAYASWSGAYGTIANASARVVIASIEKAAPTECVVVLLGLPESALLFKLFSDASSKAQARAMNRDSIRCTVVTETTPRQFVYPVGFLPSVNLPQIELSIGAFRLDHVWDGVRYRYRLPAKNWATLDGARFFEWRGARFDDVTDAVRSGARPILPKG